MAAIEVSAPEARRITLHAQGLGRPRPAGAPAIRHVRGVVSRLGAVQIDAVNVLVRAHYLTLFSRLGPYPMRLLDDLTDSRREAFEYWGHAASILPIELHPLLRWRMARQAEHKNWAAFKARVERERPGYLAAVEREVVERGPIAFTDLADPARRENLQTTYAASTVLWDRASDGKSALEGLFGAGRLAAAGRKGFQRRYDLTERVIPAEVLALPTPDREDAQRALVLHAARALGVATANEIRYYFFLAAAEAKARIRELVDSGDLLPARVEGWAEPAYLDPAARRTRVRARTLISPFDSLLWERDRVERLFGFRHSFELYVKPAQRRYGYFVLPFLLGESMVARVDLKADRARRTLLVLGAFGEPSAPAEPAEIAAELAAELRELAGWLDLDAIEVAGATPLSRDLGRLLRP